MPRIKLFLMRHSKSCCNHLRLNHPELQEISNQLADPGLTVEGERVATAYGPMLRRSLSKAGFDTDGCLVASSELKRARQTARLVFGRPSTPLPHFKEFGVLPENTPTGQRYSPPKWGAFIATIAGQVKDGDSMVVVGHGSYLTSLWPKLTGKTRPTKLRNMDGILLDADVSAAGIRVHSHREILCPLRFNDGADRCRPVDERKITVLGKRMTKKQRCQKGGGSMPLGIYQDGAQMQGTTGEPSGLDLGISTGSMARTGISQTGGSRRQGRRQTGGRRFNTAKKPFCGCDSQRGGFSPSIMGAFVTNGLQLAPVASYVGYRMYKNQKPTRKAKGSKRTTRRASSRT
jgi:phosphohistidine phosphatase SixA